MQCVITTDNNILLSFRTLWVLMFLMMVIIYSYFFINTLISYFSWPTNTNIEFHSTQNLSFPAVTVCNYNIANSKSYILSLICYVSTLIVQLLLSICMCCVRAICHSNVITIKHRTLPQFYGVLYKVLSNIITGVSFLKSRNSAPFVQLLTVFMLKTKSTHAVQFLQLQYPIVSRICC